MVLRKIVVTNYNNFEQDKEDNSDKTEPKG